MFVGTGRWRGTYSPRPRRRHSSGSQNAFAASRCCYNNVNNDRVIIRFFCPTRPSVDRPRPFRPYTLHGDTLFSILDPRAQTASTLFFCLNARQRNVVRAVCVSTRHVSCETRILRDPKYKPQLSPVHETSTCRSRRRLPRPYRSKYKQFLLFHARNSTE